MEVRRQVREARPLRDKGRLYPCALLKHALTQRIPRVQSPGHEYMLGFSGSPQQSADMAFRGPKSVRFPRPVLYRFPPFCLALGCFRGFLCDLFPVRFGRSSGKGTSLFVCQRACSTDRSSYSESKSLFQGEKHRPKTGKNRPPKQAKIGPQNRLRLGIFYFLANLSPFFCYY